jgi:predicted transcriptional regulator
VEEAGYTYHKFLISRFLSSQHSRGGSVSKYRDRLEIIVDILNAAADGARKTKIMYVANLSYRLLERYLDDAIRMGFIYSDGNGYEVTNKGKTFLEKYNDFSSKYSKVENEFEKLLFEREALERLCGSLRYSSYRHILRRRRCV